MLYSVSLPLHSFICFYIVLFILICRYAKSCVVEMSVAAISSFFFLTWYLAFSPCTLLFSFSSMSVKHVLQRVMCLYNVAFDEQRGNARQQIFYRHCLFDTMQVHQTHQTVVFCFTCMAKIRIVSSSHEKSS